MSLNKAMLIGNVGQDPEVRYIDNGSCTARLSLATSTPGYTLPNGTQVPERTEWHKLLFWGKLAQVVERYVHKGDKLYVEGSIRTNVYTDRQGRQHDKIEIWVNSMEMLTPKSQSQANNSQTSSPETIVQSRGKEQDGATPVTQPPAPDSNECPF